MRYFLLTLVLFLCIAPALATDYTLDENCTLADAIRAANADEERGECPAGDGADTITLTADITLEGELPRVLSDITIDGAGHTISGNEQFRIFYVDGGALTLQNIHLTAGLAHNEVSFTFVDGVTGRSKSGGAIIANRGSRLELIVNSRFTDNVAEAYGGVAAIAGTAKSLISRQRIQRQYGSRGWRRDRLGLQRGHHQQ